MKNQKWGLWVLTAFVIGNMIGGGIFMLPANMANSSSPIGSMLAWSISGFGVLMIAFVFGNLATRKPELKAGPQSYAQSLFKSPKNGKIAGYSMAWGYWAANWAGTASVIIAFAGYLSTFFPVMESKSIIFSLGSFELELGKFISFLVCTSLLWGLQTILANRFDSIGKLNLVATAAKIIGFTLFIILTVFAFDASNLGNAATLIKDGKSIGLGSQINAASIATLWAFVGIESAIMLSNRARSASDIKKATIIGLIVTVAIYAGITVLTMGALSQDALRASQRPLVDALDVVVGSGSAKILAILALVSLFGATCGWILVSAEVPYQAAKNGLFPIFFAKVNKKNSPVRSLTVTNVMTQIFLFSTVSGNVSEAYDFAMVVATLAFLIPYLVSALYGLKLVITGETYKLDKGSRRKDFVITTIALIYSSWVVYTGTADLKTFALGIGLFVVGLLLYPVLMKEKKNERPTNVVKL